ARQGRAARSRRQGAGGRQEIHQYRLAAPRQGKELIASMAEARVTIINPLGLHARAAAKFVKLAQKFPADVRVAKDSQAVAGTSIGGLMMRAAGPGDEIKITAEGTDAEAALAALKELVSGGFGEM